MLKVDLGRLRRTPRIELDAQIAPDDALWEGTAATFMSPLDVRLSVQAAAGDVVVRGRVRGVVETQCRRCLEPVRREIDEPVTLVFRAGIGPAEAESSELYPLPERGELDLSGPLREHVMLALPQFVTCREACRGLCPHCGASLNTETCECGEPAPDERWAALRRLELD